MRRFAFFRERAGEIRAMALQLSRKSECVMQSEIRNMSLECQKVGGINLSQGVCDTEVPEAVRRAAQAAMDAGCNTYTRYDGLPELRQALARKLKRGGLDADPDSEITVCSGATGAFYCACQALLNPGDEVILFEPYYGYHLSTLRALDLVPRYVKLHAPQWHFNIAELEAACSPRTRGIMLNTPANPSGKVFSASELQTLAAFACKHDLFVFTDEIYEYFVFDGQRHLSPAALPGMKERTITISGLSKTFSITGWRIGYTVAAAQWAQAIGFFNDLIYVCAPAPLQKGVAAGLDSIPPDYYKNLRSQYEAKRDKICGALDRAGLTPHVPQGAYYVLADVSRVRGPGSKARALEILRRTGVAAVPGSAFFSKAKDGDHLARFCFAKEDAVLDKACQLIESTRC